MGWGLVEMFINLEIQFNLKVFGFPPSAKVKMLDSAKTVLHAFLFLRRCGDWSSFEVINDKYGLLIIFIINKSVGRASDVAESC